MSLHPGDPLLKLQATLQTDFRIEALLKELTFTVEDSSYLDGPLPDANIPTLFQNVMNKKEREAYQRKRQRAAAIEALRSVLRQRPLARPLWRWIAGGYSLDNLDPDEHLLQGQSLFRSVSIAVVWLARLRLAAVHRRRVLALTASSEQAMAVGVHSEMTATWLRSVCSVVTDSLWDADVQLDMYAPPTRAEWAAALQEAEEKRKAEGKPPAENAVVRMLGFATRDAGYVARARAHALKARVTAIMDTITATLGDKAGSAPPLPVRAFWSRLSADGFYFPPFYLTVPERGQVSFSPSGDSRWMRPLRLQAPDVAADPLLAYKLRPDDPIQPQPLQPPHSGVNRPRASPVSSSYRYSDEEQAAASAKSKGRRHSAADLGFLRVRSWAGEDRAVMVYGPRAAGDFRRVEAVTTIALILRGLIAAVLLDARPSPTRVRQAQAAGVDLKEMVKHGRANARVLASALYYVLGRILPGVQPGTFSPRDMREGKAGPQPAPVTTKEKDSKAQEKKEGKEGAGPATIANAGASVESVGDPTDPLQVYTFGRSTDPSVPSLGENAPVAPESPVAADKSKPVKLRRDSILRVGAGVAPVAAAQPVPFEQWVCSQVLPPWYFHGQTEEEAQAAAAPKESTVVEMGSVTITIGKKEGAASVKPGRAEREGILPDGTIKPDLCVSAMQPWFEDAEARMRTLACALGRYALTYNGKRWRAQASTAAASAQGLDALVDEEMRALAFDSQEDENSAGPGGHEGPSLVLQAPVL